MFSSPQLEDLLRGADSYLERRAEVVLVGGAVISLVYGGSQSTKDLDFVNASAEARRALEKAAAKLGIPIQDVSGIYCAPKDWEDRRESFDLPGLKHLSVYVPERYDLAMMKLARGEETDLAAVQELHATGALEPGILYERYRDTLVLGDGQDFKFAFLGIIERFYGNDECLRILSDLEPDGC